MNKAKLESILLTPSRNGLTKPKAIRGSGIKMLSMKEIFSYSRIQADVDSIELVLVTEYEKNTFDIQNNDLLFARQSLTLEGAGKCAIVKNVKEDIVFESHLIRIRIDKTVAIPDYIYYYFTSTTGKAQISSIVEQVAAAGIRGSDLVKLEVPCPDIYTQTKIASILQDLDDKIDLNSKINENLQQQAQALFKSWFVDFEPWGGVMPEDWRVGTLSELIDVCYGKDHKILQNGKYPAYGSGGIMRFVEKYIYEKESVLIPRKGTLNNVIYVNKPFWTIDTMFFTKMKKENIAKYVYLFISNINLSSMNTGSAVPSMTIKELNSINIPIPSDQIFGSFEERISQLYELKEKNNTTSERLSQLRDTLLPKLMSGELDVSSIDL